MQSQELRYRCRFDGCGLLHLDGRGQTEKEEEKADADERVDHHDDAVGGEGRELRRAVR